MRIRDWSSDVCSSDLDRGGLLVAAARPARDAWPAHGRRMAQRSFRRLGRNQIGPARRALDAAFAPQDRKSVVEGKSVSVRVDLGVGRIIKKTNNTTKIHINQVSIDHQDQNKLT